MTFEFDEETNILTVHNLRNNYSVEQLQAAKNAFKLFGSIEYDLKRNVFDFNKADENILEFIDTDSEEGFRETMDNLIHLTKFSAYNKFVEYFKSSTGFIFEDLDFIFFSTRSYQNSQTVYMEIEDFKKELSKFYSDDSGFVFNYLDIYRINGIKETEEGSYLVEIFNGHDEFWTDNFVSFIPKKINLKRITTFQEFLDLSEE